MNGWLIELNPLQCLTLMRVLEESLTNVIKHSQAKTCLCRCSLYNPINCYSKIQDNMIGFEATAFLEHGMSIGMRSMKCAYNG